VEPKVEPEQETKREKKVREAAEGEKGENMLEEVLDDGEGDEKVCNVHACVLVVVSFPRYANPSNPAFPSSTFDNH
jgi:hypothetical protein